MAVLHARRTGVRLGVLAAVVTGQANAGEPFMTTIALRANAAPGAPGSSFDSFDAPLISRNGQIVFSAELTAPGAPNASSVWTWVNGALRLELLEGDPVFHGSATFANASVSYPVLNAAGDLLVLAGDHQTGGWSIATPFELSAGGRGAASVAADGFPIAGFWEGDPLGGIYPPKLNEDGDLAFMGHRRQGLWTTRAGELLAVRKAGDHAWGSEQGQFVWFGTPAQNSDGSLAFKGLVTNPDGEGSRAGIWTNETDRRRRIVIEDMPAPGSGFGGTQFKDFGAEPRLNSAGRVAFLGRIKGNATSTSDSAIWSDHGVTLQAAVREGQFAIGTGAQFSAFHPEFVLGSTGRIAFVATLESEPYRNSGVFCTDEDGTVQVVARENLKPPGEAGNVRFKVFSPPIMNQHGQIAFVAQLFGTDVDRGGNQVLMYADAGLKLHTIVRTGREIQVGPDRRVVELIDLAGMEPGEGRSPMSADGAIVFRLVFTDGSSGIFLARVDCPADIATQGIPTGDPGSAQPDGAVSYADLDLYMRWWNTGDLRADMSTTGTGPGDEQYGEPDGAVDQADLGYYSAIWAAGCQ